MSDYGTDWVDEPQLVDAEGQSYISASQIKEYSKCPKQYWYEYKTEKPPTKKSKGYRELGSRVHEAIENVLRSDEITFSESHLEQNLKREYRQIDGYELSRSMYNDGFDFLEVAARFIAAQQPNIRDLEKEVYYSLSREDIDSRLKSYIDVCTENEIWDWKTGRIRDDTELDEKIQGAVYMKAYEQAYGEPPENIRFVYLKEETQRALQPSDAIWDEMIDHAAALTHGLENDEFPAKPGEMCFWCGWEMYCDESQVGVGDIDYIQF